MLRTVASGVVDLDKLVTRTVTLDEGVDILMGMDDYNVLGVAVIDRFA